MTAIRGRRSRGRAWRRGEGVLPASRGVGPLLQRDYWAVIARCRVRPSEVAELVATRFPELAPEDLVVFRRVGAADRPLRVGDVMEVRIRAAGTFRVRVVHRDRNSLTVATMTGHPEAGRITFGAYRDSKGRVIFHIRSRARSSTTRMHLGFLATGEPMQTNTWAEFVDRVAATVGQGVRGFIVAETRRVEPAPEDVGEPDAPTFVARGD